ncbi:MAG: phosphate/phosphite/phosphonate ABC transporter substrate-binding protein [Bdellovibrionota bacterium]
MKKLFALLTIALLASCSDGKVGSKERPFSMYFIPSVDAQKLNNVSSDMAKYVSKYVSQKLYQKDEGFYVKASVPTSYIAVVEAFGTKKADFATFNTFSYILTRDIKKYPIEAVIITLRGDGEKTYKGQIIARADSGIKTLEDLKGKTFAYTDAASTSGFILPSKLLRDKGIELKDTVFAQKHDNVVTMVYQKQVDAGATYYSNPITEELEGGKKVTKITDARARVMTQFPDVEKAVNIIGYTEEIPNEPWVLRTNLYDDPAENEKIKGYVVDALQAFGETAEGRVAIKELATATSLERVTDATYEGIRQIILANKDLNLEEIVKKGK